MVDSKFFTLFILIFCCTTVLKGQIGLRVPKNDLSGTPTPPPLQKESFGQYKTHFNRKNTQIIDNQYFRNKTQAKIVKQLPSVFAVEKMPFFCKIEYKMGLNKKLPLKFRLGDVQYVDELEGK